MIARVALVVVVFAVVTAVADLVGAANLGTAATFGQMAVALTVVGLIVRGP